jgi:acetyl esterase/lipase
LFLQSGFMLDDREGRMKTRESAGDRVVVHALDPEDASAIIPMRTAGVHTKRRALEDRVTKIFRHVDGRRFAAGSATAYRNLVGHIAARACTAAFVPDYRLDPDHPFPAAIDDVLAAYRGMDDSGIRRIAVTGDSAGGNLALVPLRASW